MDIRRMIQTIRYQLDTYPMVGISPRSGSQENGMSTNTRLSSVYGLDLAVLRRENIRLGRVCALGELDVALSLVKAGYQTVCLNSFAYRTSTRASQEREQSRAIRQLQRLHPGLVTVRENGPRVAWDRAAQ